MKELFLTEIRRLPETRRLRLTWDDGHCAEMDYDYLRGYCPCAGCQGHGTGEVKFKPPAEPVEPLDIRPVGNYAISIQWSDAHDTGIFRFDFLRHICPCDVCAGAAKESEPEASSSVERSRSQRKGVIMKGLVFLLFGLMVVVGMVKAAGDDSSRVVLETSKGELVIALDTENAPVSTENFLGYVEAGFYEGTVFHRVIDGFMIQGGGFTQDMAQKETRGTIQNEADNGVKNKRGTLAMARRPDPHSATAQFFVNVADNDFLDHKNKSDQGWGYAVFGEVVEGMDVVDAIAKVETGRRGPMGDVPVEPVIIQKAYVQDATSAE